MKQKWNISYSREFSAVVEAESFDEIQEWFLMETPAQKEKIREINQIAIPEDGNEAVWAGEIVANEVV